MKKKLLKAIGLSLLAVSMAACGGPKDKGGDNDNTPAQTITYTVAFEVDGTRVATSRVKQGEKVTDNIADPVKAGYTFVGWYEGDTLVDLATYVVTHNVTLVAHFEEFSIPEYNINDTKVADKSYYLVLGWWECTGYKDDGVTPKLTSYLTPDLVRLFYHNLRAYLTTIGATEENLNAISFRNYSSVDVATMGAAVNADADVDILIGVGNNINSTAGVTLHNSSNEYKFTTNMGIDNVTDPEHPAAVSRYVACPSSASDFGVATYEWLRDTQAGKDAFVKLLSQAEIDASLVPEVIDLTVTVHGDGEPVSTHLTDKETPVTMPTITVPETHNFKGFALSEGGEVALDVAKDAVLKYKDLKDLVAANQNTLDLYPVLEAKPVVLDDLVVYVQINGSNLTEAEAKLLEARFNASLTEEKHVKFNLVDGDAATFTAGLGDDADVVIGGNNPLKNYVLYDGEHYPLANAGAKHFASTNRKVIIRNTVAASHVALAVQLYNFVIADAAQYEFHYTYWHKNHTWVTETEINDIDEAINDNINHYFACNTPNEYKDKYNIVLTSYEATNTGVADLGAETRALREGKGTDLIIGCGGNAASTGGMTFVEEVKAIPTTIVAADRKIGLCNENPLARYTYDIFDNLYDIYR